MASRGLLSSVAFILSLALRVTLTLTISGSPGDKELVYTIPRIIDHPGNPGANRERREADACADVIEIILPTQEEDVRLVLEASHGVLSPWLNVERRRGDETTAETLQYDGCLYQGKVEGDAMSYAAISTGSGVLGVYENHGRQYSIQPASVNQNETELHEEETWLHVISELQERSGYESLLDEGFTFGDAHRVKRQARPDKHLEVMVVVDYTILDFHGGEKTELFILALFNMMNLIYSHNSLGVTIQLSLVKIVLLDNEVADNMWEGGEPRTTLDRFCLWSADNSLRDREVGHYDFAMYLSRDRMSPAGYAPVTGMCRPDRSCALIKEEGFSAAFVAAHEIAHTIGLSHDGEGTNKCVNEPKRGSLMAPLVMANLHNYFWSPCSKEEIDRIINSLYCLNDSPFDYNWTELVMPLGSNWDLDEQCRKEFGDGYKLCSRLTHNFNPCEHLWCSTPDNRYLCKTKKAPPLPGSECGESRWCFNEQCVVADPDDVEMMSLDRKSATEAGLDGSWSNWSSWSKCSTTCGQGIKSRTRTCDNPRPRLGGQDCEGESYELRVCNLPTCNKDIDDSRAEQCSKYNKRGRTYVPFEPEDEADQCTLNCKTEEENTPLYGSIEAQDGTFCSYDDRSNMCYSGQCIRMGCDGKLGSLLREDLCGVCDGDNTNCTMRQDYYNEKLDRGYQLLVRLYPGTRHFRIKKPDDAFRLVLVNLKTNSSILPQTVDDDFSVVDHGALWKFSDGRSQTLETAGPLQAEYDVIIYSTYSGLRATLSVSFTEPTSIKREADSREKRVESGLIQETDNQDQTNGNPYEWISVGWSNCSQPCGSGWQRELFSCYSTRTNRSMPDILCDSTARPKPARQPCNVKECSHEFRWVTSDWMQCPDIICETDDEVEQRRWVFCVKENPAVGTTWHRVDDSSCDIGRKPELNRPCNKSHCPVKGYWKTDSWSRCSVTCGRGQQRRDVTCLALIEPRGPRQVVCDETKPSEVEECSSIPCVLANTLETITTTPTTTASTTTLMTTLTATTTAVPTPTTPDDPTTRSTARHSSRTTLIDTPTTPAEMDETSPSVGAGEVTPQTHRTTPPEQERDSEDLSTVSGIENSTRDTTVPPYYTTTVGTSMDTDTVRPHTREFDRPGRPTGHDFDITNGGSTTEQAQEKTTQGYSRSSLRHPTTTSGSLEWTSVSRPPVSTTPQNPLEFSAADNNEVPTDTGPQSTTTRDVRSSYQMSTSPPTRGTTPSERPYTAPPQWSVQDRATSTDTTHLRSTLPPVTVFKRTFANLFTTTPVTTTSDEERQASTASTPSSTQSHRLRFTYTSKEAPSPEDRTTKSGEGSNFLLERPAVPKSGRGNRLSGEEPEDREPLCEADLSGVCALMNQRKCRLPLFQNLCCSTCHRY